MVAPIDRAEMDACELDTVTYSGTIVPLIQQRCTSCHSGPVALSFSTHAGLLQVAQNGRLAASIQHQAGAVPIPPGGPMNKLDPCDIAAVLAWIDAGALDN